jgi:hypothetical protein
MFFDDKKTDQPAALYSEIKSQLEEVGRLHTYYFIRHSADDMGLAGSRVFGGDSSRKDFVDRRMQSLNEIKKGIGFLEKMVADKEKMNKFVQDAKKHEQRGGFDYGGVKCPDVIATQKETYATIAKILDPLRKNFEQYVTVLGQDAKTGDFQKGGLPSSAISKELEQKHTEVREQFLKQNPPSQRR